MPSSPPFGSGEPSEGGYFTGSDRNYGGGQGNYGSAGGYDDWGDRRGRALDRGHELSDFGGPVSYPSDRHSQPTGSRDAPHRAGGSGGYRDEGDRPTQKHVDWDADYHQWRTEQIRNLDNDYAEWRRDRYRKFSEEFDGWRRTRVQAGAAAAPADDKGGADDRASSLTPKK